MIKNNLIQAAPPATRAREMTQQESNILVQNFIKTLVKVDSYPYAVGFMGSVLISLLSGKSTPEQEIEMITNYIIENGGTK